MGRPPKELDDVLQQRIIAVIERGGTRTAAAQAAGVGRSTLLGWLARGRKGDERFLDFLDRIRRAEATAEVAMSDVLFIAGQSDARYALEWLSRRRSKTWAKRENSRPAVPSGANTAPPMTFDTADDALAFVDDIRADLMAQGARASGGTR